MIPFDGKYSPDIQCRWSSYNIYRLLLLMYFLNESSTLITPAKTAHSSFYILHSIVHLLTVIFVGIPLIYSEICVAQYTNCTFISMWNFFPLFRGLGYGMVFSVIIRTMYLNCLASWYFIYTFYAALNPPPWSTCDYFDDKIKKNCIVKKVNVSEFQHCLEKVRYENRACSFYTASFKFFEIIVSENNTSDYPKTCFVQWKAIVAVVCINIVIFILTIKKVKFLQIAVRLVILYVGVVLLVLFSVVMTLNGSWELTSTDVSLEMDDFWNCMQSMTSAFLSIGSGTGMVVFLSRDASFRSPATRTAIITSLFRAFICLLLALILYSGIKIMSYYHGGEDRVIEQGSSLLYIEIGSVSEIISYFGTIRTWGFLYFSSIFCCLLMNIWISYVCLNELFFNNFMIANKYNNLFRFIIKLAICLLSLPFLCADLFESLIHVSEILQLLNSFCFSISLYWFYGYDTHSIDITFMIGVKSSAYWKVAWGFNPIMIMICLYTKLTNVYCRNFSYVIINEDVNDEELTIYWLFLYILIGIYVSTVFIGSIFEMLSYEHVNLRKPHVPSQQWGPKDMILYKSRNTFIPAIMTREFLYRQVRIRGYRARNKKYLENKTKPDDHLSIESQNKIEWSALTSN